MARKEVTGKKAGSNASGTMRTSAKKAEKSASASALSQRPGKNGEGAKKETSAKAASLASKVMRTSSDKKAKSAAASALTQRRKR